METLKTAIVVLLLLAVLYGVYVILDKPALPPTREIAWHQQKASEPLQIDEGTRVAPRAAPGGDGWTRDPSPPVPSPGGDFTPPPHPNASLPAPNLPAEVSSPTPAAKPAEPAADTDSRKEPVGEKPSPPAAAPPVPSAPAADSPAWKPPAATASSDPARQDGKDAETASEPPGAKTPGESLVAQPPAAAPAKPPTEPPASAPEDRAPTSPPADATAGKPEGTPNAVSQFARVMQAAEAKIREEKWYEALFTLSLHYGSPDLTPDEHRQLLDLLDPLAAKVIYSTEHLIEPAYEVRRGETLADIAQRYNVAWQLLANINGIKDPQVLLPGTKLKVVPGPFRAEVDLTRKELTLFAGRLYAGRFPITVGNDPSPRPGEYQVNDKQPGRTYYAGDGRTIAAGDPENPYGQVWIDLGGDLCIHGGSEKGESRLGCISLSPIDANDVFGILCKGSGVVIRR